MNLSHVKHIVCYDPEGLESRKEHKPENSAIGMASGMGIELLTEEQYRELQKLGIFDKKTSSWVKTPSDIRKLGGAIFAEFRYGNVFIFHNSAPSYYSVRGFRGSLRFWDRLGGGLKLPPLFLFVGISMRRFILMFGKLPYKSRGRKSDDIKQALRGPAYAIYLTNSIFLNIKPIIINRRSHGTMQHRSLASDHFYPYRHNQNRLITDALPCT